MPSRISGACTPCRSKKQKCSGHHPICSQCANASIDCTWPEQRKRGPAKGYIEALESRLHSAESLLLAMLPLVSDNLIERASNSLRYDDDDDLERTGTRRSSPPLLNKKTGLDYWDSFPIDTRRNIRKWQFDCEANSTNNNIQYTHTRDISNGHTVNRHRSRTHSHSHSPAPVAMNTSPQGSLSQGSLSMSQPGTWVQSQSIPAYVTHGVTHGQLQSAQQLMNLSATPRRDHQQQQQWLTTPQHHHSDSMQLDPNLMPSRSMPPQPTHLYATNGQQNLFW